MILFSYIFMTEQEHASWYCVWKANTAVPVQHLAFSPDGTLFATCGENDRLVKIWYENKHCKYLLKILCIVVILKICKNSFVHV